MDGWRGIDRRGQESEEGRKGRNENSAQYSKASKGMTSISIQNTHQEEPRYVCMKFFSGDLLSLPTFFRNRKESGALYPDSPFSFSHSQLS
jgi:hypothetical protein